CAKSVYYYDGGYSFAEYFDFW
nr:immunoglobulin heavy chain junction region [Macaca mulatta]MOW77116.1 immunoglobulin heavy chain junction region [Macaca mulatta]MOW78289.1 immunoglobulin heavy chain junction region [Macaca mulatta]MOW78390.1 immunoglobulin heavy chain junction region [Macaca mulatta]MOW80446.1 immunoglobulin heavy chain junction region [Macaca mulatta]